jgi:Family of unknown function (DUF6603)
VNTMSEKDTITFLAEELGSVFDPLIDAITSSENFHTFMLRLGWDMRVVPEPIRSLVVPVQNIREILKSGEVNASNVGSLIIAIKSLINTINQISSQPDNLFPSTVDANEFKREFPTQLIQFLVIEYLLYHNPRYGSVLKAMGIIRIDEVEATATRPTYASLKLAWEDLVDIFENPFGILTNAYKWGSTEFKEEDIMENIWKLVRAFGIDIHFETLESTLESFITKDAIDDHQKWAICVPITVDRLSDTTNFAVCLFTLPRTPTDEAGLSIIPYGNNGFDKELELSDDLMLKIEATMDLAGGIALLIRPGKSINLLYDIISSVSSGTEPPSSDSFAVALKSRGGGDSKTILIGSNTGSRLEFSSVSTKGGVRLDSTRNVDAFIEFELKDGAIIIKAADDADSFLSSLLPRDGFSSQFSLTVGFSTRQGFYFAGSSGLEVTIPSHVDMGLIEIVSSTIAIKADSGAIPIDIGATIKGNLGPLTAVVENMGLRARFTFPPDSNGNLGPVNLSLDFKPPSGIGLSIDAGVVKGGGYLYIDIEKEQYAGALELVVSEFLTLKAIGLITTRMPDGSRGFSLLVIITAEFGSPMQLGFGFTLSGVGGLLGLHRTMRLQPLSEGVRTGAVNSVMFPTNIIENATRIISDLRTFFPPLQDIFLIGPMAKIGWGTPNLVKLSLGIIIEIPGNIAILGVLKVTLPDEDKKLLNLQVNFIGAIEPDKKQAWFFASLFESRVLSFTIEGEMGVLVNWGDNANFVVSVGGFHPAFNPPPLPFPEPRRIAISILNTEFAKIQVEGYFAITSNTVQFGAHAELYFGLSAFKIDGQITFDALFQFSPFYFVISISASLSVKVFGVGLFSVRIQGSLEGPTPWHVEGTGSIKLLFVRIHVDFSHTWGEDVNTILPPIDVMPLLKAEFQKLENWKAEVPVANNILVALRKIETTDLVLHPVGTLSISQRAVPLDITIDKVGAQKPNDANYFALSVDPVVGVDIEEKGEVKEMFAMAQVKDMSDSEKLSSPPFEKQKGGVELSAKGEEMRTSSAVKRVVRYEQIIIDSNFKRFVKPFFVFYNTLFDLFLKGNAITKSTLSNKSRKQRMPLDDKISVMPTAYVVAFNTDNSPFNEDSMAFSSHAQAHEFMKQQVRKDLNLKDKLHVIPQVEMSVTA